MRTNWAVSISCQFSQSMRRINAQVRIFRSTWAGVFPPFDTIPHYPSHKWSLLQGFFLFFESRRRSKSAHFVVLLLLLPHDKSQHSAEVNLGVLEDVDTTLGVCSASAHYDTCQLRPMFMPSNGDVIEKNASTRCIDPGSIENPSFATQFIGFRAEILTLWCRRSRQNPTFVRV